MVDPIPIGYHFFTVVVRRIYRHLKKQFKKTPSTSSTAVFRGHPAVTRSLVEGLEKQNVPHMYDPVGVEKLTENVIVLSGVSTLKQAIKLKKKGVIQRLFAGPNIVVFASDENFILADPAIDLVVTPSDWVIDLYEEDVPGLRHRCISWPAGVDLNYWTPGSNRQKLILFYLKVDQPSIELSQYFDLIKAKGYKIEIINYGEYDLPKYRTALQKSLLLVGFSASESQGIAWAEAWACDVPTLIWKNDVNRIYNRQFHCDTAPYLSAQTGQKFQDFQDFISTFDNWERNPHQFAPRQWVKLNMSDELSAVQLIDKLETHLIIRN